MRKFISFLTFIALSLCTWADNDICKIKVKRTEKGFTVTAGSTNVYVRPGGNVGSKNYVFFSCDTVEILCNDSSTINLKGGHQEKKVTCWSQEGEKEKRQDKDNSHQLAPAQRRNWLVFSNNIDNEGVNITISAGDGETKDIKINFRRCEEWNHEKAHISYKINGKDNESSADRIFKKNEDRYICDKIELKSGESLSELKVTHPEESNIVFKEVRLDGKKIRKLIYKEDNTPLDEDDIMYSTYIIADSLLNEQLPEGNHEISYDCTVLTEKGPQEVTLIVPIEVEKSNNILSKIGIIVGILVVIVVLGILGIKLIDKKKNKKGTDNNTTSPKGENAPKGGNQNPENPEDRNNNGGNGNDPNKGTTCGLSNDETADGAVEDEHQKEDTAEQIIKKLKKCYGTEDLTEISKNIRRPEDLKKDGIKSVINKWNAEHPENPVDYSQINIAPFIHVIGNGYISPKGKQLLEKSLTEFGVKYEGLIEAYVIEKLYQAIYNKGCVDGAAEATKNNGAKVLLEELTKQNRELSEAKTKLENEKKVWKGEKDSFEKNNKKLQENYDIICDENFQLHKQTELKDTLIKELEQQINVQSQEHVAELEVQIKQLSKDIASATETIAGKDIEIAAEQKKVENITKKKEEWEAKYNKVNDELNAIAEKHEVEVDKLKSDHKEAYLKQKDKYERLLENKNSEIENLKILHSEQLSIQKTEYEGKLTGQKKEAEETVAKLNKEKENAISTLNAQHQGEVNKLNRTIEELGKSVNVGRDETIEKANQILAAINEDLSKVDEAVSAIVNQAPIFVTIIKDIRSGLQGTIEQFNDYEKNEWAAPDKLQQQVIEDMQDIFINEALVRSGWMNNVARLLSYSRLPKLHDGIDMPAELEAHGLDSALLENINAKMVTLLGIADMGLLVPAVLANNFDKENYDYKNADTWIDQFFPEVNTRNYKDKVFDIVQVGYTINGQTERKPVVQYN